jgi:hypothetical protein
MILPFLILAFTVNGMRDGIRNSKRRLDYKLMDVKSRWKKILIRLRWVTSPVWYPIYKAWDFIYWSVWDPFWDWVNDAVRWVKGVVLESITMVNTHFKTIWSSARIREVSSDDPESQEAKDRGASSVTRSS